MTNAKRETATAFAPATIANLGVGFDILGFSFGQVGDRVKVTRNLKTREVKIKKISGLEGLPLEAGSNTATAGLIKLLSDRKFAFGFDVEIEKGIPVGSGLGGSAASAVGAIVAANALLDTPLSKQELVEYAMEGEFVASGSRHADNVAPAIYGGLVLIKSNHPVEIIELPWPQQLMAILVHPKLRVDTKDARAVLQAEVPLKKMVEQTANLAGFVAGCFKGDLSLIARSVEDVVIEPQRSKLITGFAEVKQAAKKAGALGVSISGSGPSVFAFAQGLSAANLIVDSMVQAFAKQGVEAKGWIAQGSQPGAQVL